MLAGAACSTRRPRRSNAAVGGEGRAYRMRRARRRPRAAPTRKPGTEIQVPDLGVPGSGKAAGDYTLTDTAGTPVPVAVVWQGEGQDALLLAAG